MRKVLFILIIFSLSNAAISMGYEKEIKTLSLSMADNIIKAGKKTIAVVDFVDLQGNVTELGRFIAEEFSVALADVKKGFEVVDRTHLKSIIKEHKLSATGLIDPQTARKLGQIAGVETLVTGTVTPFGDSVRLSVKILDTSTAKVIGASSTNIAKTKAIEELFSKGVEPEPQPSTSSSDRKTISKVDMQEFSFELQGCRLSGQTVTCYLIVTNKGNDRNLYFGHNQVTRIFDDTGNEYQVETIRFGNKQMRRSWVHNRLVSGIPVKASLSFEKISPETSKINLLEIGCQQGYHDFTVQFRNIPLTK